MDFTVYARKPLMMEQWKTICSAQGKTISQIEKDMLSICERSGEQIALVYIVTNNHRDWLEMTIDAMAAAELVKIQVLYLVTEVFEDITDLLRAVSHAGAGWLHDPQTDQWWPVAPPRAESELVHARADLAPMSKGRFLGFCLAIFLFIVFIPWTLGPLFIEEMPVGIALGVGLPIVGFAVALMVRLWGNPPG